MGNKSVLYELNVELTTKQWGISCPVDQTLIGPVQYGWDRFKKDNNSMTLGGGLLAGSSLAGTRRMIFCGYSPQWEGFYISALGGAMYVMHRTGVNYIWLRGRLDTPSIMLFTYINGKYSITFDKIDPEKYWDLYIDPRDKSFNGYFGLHHFLFDKYRTLFLDDIWRILSVGPAAKLTNSGAIGSNHIKQGALTNIEDWAGRGGLGSRLFQYHNLAGIVIGGDWHDPAMKEGKELDQYFFDHFGATAIKTDIALSEKYRYVPKFETGGTFGVNMYEGEDRIYSFNFQSVYKAPEQRLHQHKAFIADHYLQQFNEETIKPRLFSICGEPCAIACKKYLDIYKKDYEPYEALGPNIGVFDQRAAELVNHYVDTIGMDAIQAGGTVAWLMELFYEKILDPAAFGLGAEYPKFGFVSDKNTFDIVNDSKFNAEYAINIVKMILYSEYGEPFRRGIRYAAKWIDSRYSLKTIDRAVYTANGDFGCMVPNQYWTPGMLAPMPIMGKYFSYYGNDFIPPYDLGKKNVIRFIYELYSENSGSCRFHRKWVEDIIDEIILSHFDLDLDYWKINFTVVKEISDSFSSKAVFWESERVVDIIHQFLVRWKDRGLQDARLDEWIDKFSTDKFTAAYDFWNLMKRGMIDALTVYFPEPVHLNHTKFNI